MHQQAGASHMTTSQPFRSGDHLRTDQSPLIRDLTFSPLTSSEFKELERQNLASYSTNPMAAFDAFPDDLENIVNIAGGLPTGSGAGYGVGVLEEDNKPPQLDLRLNFGASVWVPGQYNYYFRVTIICRYILFLQFWLLKTLE